MRGIHRWLMISPHKVTVKWRTFPFEDVIMQLVNLRALEHKCVSILTCETFTWLAHNKINKIWRNYANVKRRKCVVFWNLAQTIYWYMYAKHIYSLMLLSSRYLEKQAISFDHLKNYGSQGTVMMNVLWSLWYDDFPIGSLPRGLGNGLLSRPNIDANHYSATKEKT